MFALGLKQGGNDLDASIYCIISTKFQYENLNYVTSGLTYPHTRTFRNVTLFSNSFFCSLKTLPDVWNARRNKFQNFFISKCFMPVFSITVRQKCPSKVSVKSVRQKCPSKVSVESVRRKCPSKVSVESVCLKCPSKVSVESVRR